MQKASLLRGLLHLKAILNRMKTIGIYIPRHLYASDKSDRYFLDELCKTLERNEYRVKRINLPKLRINTSEEAETFIEKYDLVALVQHDSAFYSKDLTYQRTMELLAPRLLLINSVATQETGSDKVATKRLLHEQNIPVLEDAVVHTRTELFAYLEENTLYVIKPTNRGAGAGVRLIRREGTALFRHVHGTWKEVLATDGVYSLSLKRKSQWGAFLLPSLLLALAVLLPFLILALFPLSLLLIMLAGHVFMRLYDRPYTYSPMLVEPYFNDSEDEFTSLRCTVIGNKVVEAVTRTNKKNITSNVSSGGTAERVELTAYQKEIAIASARAIGADYAGVDLLVRGTESVIGEVNIGPFTLFCKDTGVNVGRLFGEYLITKLDAIPSPTNS